MNDKELLELAAKAASVPLDDLEECWDGIGNYYRAWNPLTDDGDAMGLAAKLGMTVNFQTNNAYGKTANNAWIHTTDKEVRRAIVRAAAEIGRNME